MFERMILVYCFQVIQAIQRIQPTILASAKISTVFTIFSKNFNINFMILNPIQLLIYVFRLLNEKMI
jgi:hypothetical protein